MTDWLAIGTTAGVSGITGLFSGYVGRLLERYMRKPCLVIDFSSEEGGKTEASWVQDGKAEDYVYIRGRIMNKGKGSASKCRVYIVNIEEVLLTSVEKTKFYDSTILPWPRGNFDSLDISPGVTVYYDIVRFSKHRSGWGFMYKDNFSQRQSMEKFRGTYRFTVLVCSDDAYPQRYCIDVTYDGDWNSVRAVGQGSTAT